MYFVSPQLSSTVYIILNFKVAKHSLNDLFIYLFIFFLCKKVYQYSLVMNTCSLLLMYCGLLLIHTFMEYSGGRSNVLLFKNDDLNNCTPLNGYISHFRQIRTAFKPVPLSHTLFVFLNVQLKNSCKNILI